MYRSHIAASLPLRPFSGRVLMLHDDDLERVELGARLSELGLAVRYVPGASDCAEAALRTAPAMIMIGLDDERLGGADAVAQLRELGYNGLVIGLLRDPWPQAEEHVREIGCHHAMEVRVCILELKLKLRAWMEQCAAQSAAPAHTAAAQASTHRWQQVLRRLLGRARSGGAVA